MTVKPELAPDRLTEQKIVEALIAGLKDRPAPHSLDEIKPRHLPPSGKTAMQMVYQQLPADESDEEVRTALEAMS